MCNGEFCTSVPEGFKLGLGEAFGKVKPEKPKDDKNKTKLSRKVKKDK